MLKQIVQSFFQAQETLEPGLPLVVAVSGGPDSVALIHVLVELQGQLALDLHVAHLNHALRGEESDRDQVFVQRLARTLSLPCHTQRLSPPSSSSQNTETTLRRRRYQFLSAVRREVGARWIATGHTASDQAETVLMNLLRGAGPRGLGAMLPAGPKDVMRPLLKASREVIQAYVTRNNLDYRIDATNRDTRFTRNRVRHELLPFLEERFSPQIAHTLSREAELFASLDAYLRQESSLVLRACLMESEDTVRVLNLDSLMDHHPALVRETLRRCLEDLTGENPGVLAVHVDAIMELGGGTKGTQHAALPGGVWVSREYGRLMLSTGGPSSISSPEPVFLDVREKGAVDWGPVRVKWEVRKEKGTLPETHDRIFMDLGDTHGPLCIRPVRPGDRIAPKGMEGSQKVSHVLIDHKVPRRKRHSIAVLCDNGGPDGSDRILWVIGQRRSRHAGIKPETSQVAVFEAMTKQS